MKVLAERCYSFYFYLTFVQVCPLSNKFQIFGKQSLPTTFTVIFCKGYQNFQENAKCTLRNPHKWF